MKIAAEKHLTEDRILDAVATGSALSETERAHVAACDRCRSALDGLQTDIQRLRDGLTRFTPAPSQPVRLPEGLPGAGQRTGRTWAWGLGLGTALAGLVVFFTFLQTPDRAVLPVATTPPFQEVAADPELVAARMLAENALPPVYQAITEGLAHDPAETEGFIDFLIPPLEAESASG